MGMISMPQDVKAGGFLEMATEAVADLPADGGALARPELPRRAQREVPGTWNQVHVLDRLEEAFLVLANMPMATRPKSYGNAMPDVVRERLALIDQFTLEQTDEFQEERNRVRLQVTAEEIGRMEQAIRWPVDYLSNYPEVSRSLCRKVAWSVRGFDVQRQCRRLGINRRFFNRQWQHGLTVITMRLIARRVPVS